MEAAPGGLSFYPIPFVKPIQALLICSLLLDLHKAQEDSNLKTQTSFLLTTVIQFNPEPHESSWELARMSESRATSHTLGKARGARTEEVDCT
ncbi:hypothetical protein K439DRAFT_565099 [Ramaria rubella]|nr:hypothetical protein K439DRAFT_565099 [Ramaria rubella]